MALVKSFLELGPPVSCIPTDLYLQLRENYWVHSVEFIGTYSVMLQSYIFGVSNEILIYSHVFVGFSALIIVQSMFYKGKKNTY